MQGNQDSKCCLCVMLSVGLVYLLSAFEGKDACYHFRYLDGDSNMGTIPSQISLLTALEVLYALHSTSAQLQMSACKLVRFDVCWLHAFSQLFKHVPVTASGIYRTQSQEQSLGRFLL